jgi:hypothetical protein
MTKAAIMCNAIYKGAQGTVAAEARKSSPQRESYVLKKILSDMYLGLI